MSLREKKKEETKRKLLAAARAAFAERGYGAAKTSDIAKSVGIAEGTLFNYFPTKAALFLAAMLPAPEPEESGGTRSAAEGGGSEQGDWPDALVAVVDAHLRGLASLEKELQREFMALFYGAQAAEVAGLTEFDRRLAERIEAFFDLRKAAGGERLQGFDVATATECVCGLTMSAYSVYLLEEPLSYAQMLDRLRRQLAFALGVRPKS